MITTSNAAINDDEAMTTVTTNDYYELYQRSCSALFIYYGID